MQGLRDNEQNYNKMAGNSRFWITFAKIVLCCLFVTPDILFYITDLAIMQDFQNKEKKQLQMTAMHSFRILFLRNLSWVILIIMRPYILFFNHGPAILLRF